MELGVKKVRHAVAWIGMEFDLAHGVVEQNMTGKGGSHDTFTQRYAEGA